MGHLVPFPRYTAILVENHNFSHTPCNLGIGVRDQKAFQAVKEVLRYFQLCGYVCPSVCHERDRQTDGHPATAKTALTHGVVR